MTRKEFLACVVGVPALLSQMSPKKQVLPKEIIINGNVQGCTVDGNITLLGDKHQITHNRIKGSIIGAKSKK